jgi:protein-tyrosine-phosphatase
MSLWDAANDIEELAHKMDNVRNVVELIAEDVEDPYSGALWAVYSMLDDLQKKMYIQAADVMELHREESKKGSKK